MADEKKLSMEEVRKTVATSLAAAFGFVIALMWNTVVNSGLKLAGVDTTAPSNAVSWATFLVTAIVITVVMILLIILFGRWGSSGPRRKQAE